MESIQTYLKNKTLITDGAAGTYLSSLGGRHSQVCETLNLAEPELVLEMHRRYIAAGADLIFTNTFGASVAGESLGLGGGGFYKTYDIIKSGVAIARRAAGESAYVAADIGPLPEGSFGPQEIYDEYKRVIDAFLDEGMNIFVFETFASSYYPVRFAQYIKSRVPEAFIIASFAVMPDGYSRTGIQGSRLIGDAEACGQIDAAGFNCCSGPTHLLNYALDVDYGKLYPVIMPNAGYPQRDTDEASDQFDGIRYVGSPEYFGSVLAHAAGRFKLIGGCCGTTPEHIEMLTKSIRLGEDAYTPVHSVQDSAPVKKICNAFETSLSKAPGKKVLILELDPPFTSDLSKLEKAAKQAAGFGVDALSIADSPMARPRADATVVAARLKRVAGIEVIPHICCRDKNINAIKSSLIAAHMEDIRNMLAVTGDPISDTDRGSVKSVFNINSEGLCRFLQALNSDIFSGDEMICGCAFNVNARNPAFELERLERKIEAGASFVLTQPVFSEAALETLREAGKLGVKIVAGILTPVNYKNAVFLANEMPGFSIPQSFIDRFSPDMTREEGEETGIKISASIAEKAAAFVDGYYLMVPFNRIGVAKKLTETLKARGVL